MDPWIILDRDALRHNLRVARRRAPESRIWAVIKADAYGHGLEAVARVLVHADGFAVARISEALALRAAGMDHPILVLGGVLSEDALRCAWRNRLEPVFHHSEQLRLIEGHPPPSGHRIWLKVDTGMHRMGIEPEQVPDCLMRLKRFPLGSIGLMTHLANADDPENPENRRQCERLLAFAPVSQTLSIGNSGGLLAIPESRTQWVRPGIMLYGVSPFGGVSARRLNLRPVMTFKGRLIAIHRRAPGDLIGYGGRYRCPDAMPVGLVAVGYGDGYPRQVPDGTPALLHGKRVPLIGRVSMDSLTVDLRGVEKVALGDEITLWGAGLPVETIARRAGTIGYELLCGIRSRVQRCWVGSVSG